MRRGTWIVGGLAALTVLGAGGCAPVGYIATLVTPPPRVKALYKLPTDKRVLVFVDDPTGMIADQGVQEKLSEYLRTELVANKLVKTLLPSAALHTALVALGDDGNTKIPQVAREAGADLVVYVAIQSFSLSDDDARIWQGKLMTAVRVVDAKVGKIWPESGVHQVGPIDFKPKKLIDDEIACKEHITDELARQMADRIAKLFYEHAGHELGESDFKR